MTRRVRERRPDPVDLAGAEVVLTGTDDMLGVLRAAASRAGVAAERMHVLASYEEPDGDEGLHADLAVILMRRPGDDPAFHRAHEAAERIAPLMAPDAVHVVITVSGATRLVPRIERTLTEEVLHQLGTAAVVTGMKRPFRNLRMRLGLAGLRASGVRVFRLRIAH